ncbi:protease modulator HflC [Aeromonas schubertii]|uniref:Protein HflC n=1 Tax=Aeromonas schubertii TaxID=652 RepID=A0A0S2SEN4_9GAMM|nr:protease modulator HflC [Aeromonas schubertii]ALP40148.1 membrane protease, stomatin/prohibitin family protein [Aeromonas schubertii]KUE78113.1 protease modulator HflC [Aeromonas schubertii]MBZ6073954.1 protease modulator HflC [Aeromonas schubertii]QCG49525.1 protease modulator HflC [Aeromonas schubertii]
MKKMAIGAVAVIALLGFTSVFVVDEGQRGIVVQFGKVKRDAEGQPRVYEPGLHFKVPLIDNVRKMDARIQTLDGQADRFVTSEKKDLIIDSYVKWKIEDFSKYYLATGGGNRMQAEALLKRKINNGLRSEIGNRTIKDIVSGERGAVMEDALKKMARSSELGIKVVDVRIKQINLPVEVSNSIYQRMRAERNAVAREHRSQGREKAEVLRADIDRKVTVMLADAESHARQLRGEGDAEAAKIYAESYKKDPEFFSFVRSMEAYRKSFAGNNDMMVIKPDSEFFRYLKDANAK